MFSHTWALSYLGAFSYEVRAHTWARERLRGEVKSLRNRGHDEGLHLRPLVHELLVANTNDVITVQFQQRIMTNVARALGSDVVTAINLHDKSLTDEKVDAVAKNPGLLSDRHIEPTQTRAKNRLGARVGKRLGLAQ